MASYSGPELVYCANGNRRYAEIAIEHGFTYGAQLPGTVYFRPEFCDQNWKRPNREAYLTAVQEHRPRLATVLDLESDRQLIEVLSWAEDVAPHVSEAIIIIPKVSGIVARLPREVAGVGIRLGYSVPTKHGGTQVPLWEFSGWPVHLLGGSPGQQMKLFQYMNAISVDGNMANLMANQHCAYWIPGKKPFTNRWPTLQETDGHKWGEGGEGADAPYEAFRRSCVNIAKAWGKTIQ